MKRHVLALGTVALLAACAMPPEGTTEEDVLAFDTAVASIGCFMRSESDYLPVELQTGLNREQVLGMVTYRVEQGAMVETGDGGYRLTTGNCAVVAQPVPETVTVTPEA